MLSNLEKFWPSMAHAAASGLTSNSRPIIVPVASDAFQTVPPADGKRFVFRFLVGSIPIRHMQLQRCAGTARLHAP